VNRLARLALTGVSCAAAACTGSLFQSKAAPPTIYVLSGVGAQPAAGVPPSPEIPVDLAVLKPKLITGLETDRIAVLYPDRHLDYFADSRWSGPLGDVLQDLAVQEFRARARLRSVSSDASVFASAYWLEFEVGDFQAEYSSPGSAPVVRVRIQARIGSSGDRRILGQFAAGSEQTAAANTLTAIVDAYARAADAALAEIAAHTEEVLAKTSQGR
jgi:cholesterol transport system auxiliary component